MPDRPTGRATRATIRPCLFTLSPTPGGRSRSCSRSGTTGPVSAAPGVEISFVPMGHLLGAAAVQMRLADGPRIVFGGDLGRYGRPVLQDPRSIPETDVLLVESTYGDRIHEPDDDGERLAAIIGDTIKRDGRVIIPSFAIGRAEEVLYWIKKLED